VGVLFMVLYNEISRRSSFMVGLIVYNDDRFPLARHKSRPYGVSQAIETLISVSLFIIDEIMRIHKKGLR